MPNENSFRELDPTLKQRQGLPIALPLLSLSQRKTRFVLSKSSGSTVEKPLSNSEIAFQQGKSNVVPSSDPERWLPTLALGASTGLSRIRARKRFIASCLAMCLLLLIVDQLVWPSNLLAGTSKLRSQQDIRAGSASPQEKTTDELILDSTSKSQLALRKLYVPNQSLQQFMKDRPTFLPLSANRFYSIIDALQRKVKVTTSIVPVKHWLTVSSQGRVRGYSLFEVRDPDSNIDTSKNDWVSFDQWRLPGTFYRLNPSLLKDEAFQSLGVFENTLERINPALNQSGQLGIGREKVDRYVMIQFEVQLLNPTLSTSTEINARASIDLPSSVETLTFVTLPPELAIAEAPGMVQLPVSSLPKPNQPTQLSNLYQLCSDNSEIRIALAPNDHGQSNGITDGSNATDQRHAVEPKNQPGVYLERLNVSIAKNIVNYRSDLELNFHNPTPSQLICAVPDDLDVSACLVDGNSVPFSILRSPSKTDRVVLESLELNTNCVLSILGKQSLSSSNRVKLLRPLVDGQHWLGGQVQVSIDLPWTISDYELVNCQVRAAELFGASRNLQIQFGSATSSATLILASESKPLLKSSYARLNFERDDLQVQQWLELDLKNQTSNTLSFPIGNDWIIDQIAQAKDPTPLPILNTEIGTAEISQLAWYVTNAENQRIVVVTIPEFAIGKTLLIRTQAHRAIQTGRIDFADGLIFAWIDQKVNDSLIAIRSQSPIVTTLAPETNLARITDVEAKNQFPVFNKSIDTDTHFIKKPGNSLSVIVEDKERTGYSAEAFIENQLLSNDLLQQTHRLLVQPEGSTVNEVNLLAIAPVLGTSDWIVVDSIGQLLPFEKILTNRSDLKTEMGAVSQQDRTFVLENWKIKLKQPTSSNFSIMVRQTLAIQPNGALPYFRLYEASTFRGWIDNQSRSLSTLWVDEDLPRSRNPIPPANAKFLLQSRHWTHQFQQLDEDHFADFGAAVSETDSDSTQRNRFTQGTFFSYTTKTELLNYKVVKASNEIPQQLITSVEVVHTVGLDEFGTRCQFEVFSKSNSQFELGMPTNATTKSLRIDGLNSPFVVSDQRLKFRLPKNGKQNVEIVYVSDLQHVGVASLGRDLAIEFPTAPLTENTYLDLPTDFRPQAPASGSNFEWSKLGRAVISPLIWPSESENRVANWRFQSGSNGSDNFYATNRWKYQANTSVVSFTVVDQKSIKAWHWFAFLISFTSILLTQFIRALRKCETAHPNGTQAIAFKTFGYDWPLIVMLFLYLAMAICLTYWHVAQVISSAILGALLGGVFWRLFLRFNSNSTKRNSDNPKNNNRLKVWGNSLVRNGCTLGVIIANQTFLSDDALLAAFQDDLRPSSSIVDQDQRIQPIVIPVDKDQQPTGSVVYLNQEVYDTLTASAAQRNSDNDLQIIRCRYLLEFDPQLQRLRSLVCTIECRVKATKVYQFPSSVNATSQLRQIRVNGVPALFQRQDEVVNVLLENSANTRIIFSYDLQSIESTIQFDSYPTLDTLLTIDGVPSSWFTKVRDTANIGYQVSPEANGDFRIDRTNQVSVEIIAKDQPAALPALETWLAIDPMSIECETRLFLGDWAANMKRIELEVDPRLSLSKSESTALTTWNIVPVAHDGFSKRFLISIDESHPTNQPVVLRWNFEASSFGEHTPPLTRIVEPKTEYKRWLIASVDERMVYQLKTLPNSKFRRGSSIDLRSTQRLLSNQVDAPTAQVEDDLRPQTDSGFNSAKDLSPDYVYELISSDTIEQQPIAIADISLQPIQSTATLEQIILIDPDAIKLKIQGNIDFGLGQITQLRFAVPADFSLQKIIVQQKSTNEVAWTHIIRNGTDVELVCFLNSPLTGQLSLELNGECKSPILGSRDLPWAYPKYFTSTNHTIRVYTSPDLALQEITDDIISQGDNVTSSEAIPGYSLGSVFQFEPKSDQPIPTFELKISPKQNRFLGSAVYQLESLNAATYLNVRLDLNDSQKPFDRFQMEKSDAFGLPEVEVVSNQANDRVDKVVATSVNDGITNFEINQMTNRCVVDLRFLVNKQSPTLNLPQVKLTAESFDIVLADSATLRERFTLPQSITLIEERRQQSSEIDWLADGNEQWRVSAFATEPVTLVSSLNSVEAISPTVVLNQFRIQNLTQKREILQVAGIQQLLLRTNGNPVVELELPASIRIDQVWCDQGMVSAETSQSGKLRTAKIALDPSERFCLISIRLEAAISQADRSMKLPTISKGIAGDYFLGLPASLLEPIETKALNPMSDSYLLQKNDALKKWIAAERIGDNTSTVDDTQLASIFESLDIVPLQRINQFNQWYGQRQAANALPPNTLSPEDIYEFMNQIQDDPLSLAIELLEQPKWVSGREYNFKWMLPAKGAESINALDSIVTTAFWIGLGFSLLIFLRVLTTVQLWLDIAFLISLPMVLVTSYYCNAPGAIIFFLLTLTVGATIKWFLQTFRVSSQIS